MMAGGLKANEKKLSTEELLKKVKGIKKKARQE